MGSAPDSDQQRSRTTKAAPEKLGVLVIGLIRAGVIDPPFELERRYFNRQLRAQIEPDGTVTCMGRTFCTLSSAASYARSTCTDSPPEGSRQLSCNGWSFWQFRDETGRLENIGTLRSQFLRS